MMYCEHLYEGPCDICDEERVSFTKEQWWWLAESLRDMDDNELYMMVEPERPAFIKRFFAEHFADCLESENAQDFDREDFIRIVGVGK